jgi:translation initiation factor IF-2
MDITGPLFATPGRNPSGRQLFDLFVSPVLEDNPKTVRKGVKVTEKKAFVTTAEVIAIAKMGFKRGLVFGSTVAEGFVAPGHGSRGVINNGEPIEPKSIRQLKEENENLKVKVPPMWNADP